MVGLNIENNRQDHWIPLNLLEDIIMYLVLDSILQVRPVITSQTVGTENLSDQLLRVINDILILTDIDKSAADDIRTADKLFLITINDNYNREQTFLAQMFSIPQNYITHITNAKSVNKNSSGRHLLAERKLIHVHFYDLAHLRNHNVLAFGSHAFSQHSMLP